MEAVYSEEHKSQQVASLAHNNQLQHLLINQLLQLREIKEHLHHQVDYLVVQSLLKTSQQLVDSLVPVQNQLIPQPLVPEDSAVLLQPKLLLQVDCLVLVLNLLLRTQPNQLVVYLVQHKLSQM